LYNIADCFVSTSLNEGFGMPQLEAMMCKCPVVTAHNSAMIEVVAGRGVTVEGWQEQKWLDEICRVVDLGRDSFYADDLNLRQFDWTFIIKGLVRYIGSKNEIAC
jgi:glycosyltransferase involved in cell wall biosynthesis